MSDRQLQVSGRTALNRHGRIFAAAASAASTAKRVLSFGCSTGEEVHTLHHYFPNAIIVGVDVDAAAIDAARNRWPSYQFGYPSSVSSSSFDVIFAMSVLCRWPEQRAGSLPFADFRDACVWLDQRLVADGLLVAFNCAFDPMEVLKGYSPVPTAISAGFVKVRTPAGEDREQLEHVLFRKGIQRDQET